MVFIYLLKSYSPVNRTGSTRGFSQVQISHIKYNTKHAHYILKDKHNPKVSPFGIALATNGN